MKNMSCSHGHLRSLWKFPAPKSKPYRKGHASWAEFKIAVLRKLILFGRDANDYNNLTQHLYTQDQPKTIYTKPLIHTLKQDAQTKPMKPWTHKPIDRWRSQIIRYSTIWRPSWRMQGAPRLTDYRPSYGLTRRLQRIRLARRLSVSITGPKQ